MPPARKVSPGAPLRPFDAGRLDAWLAKAGDRNPSLGLSALALSAVAGGYLFLQNQQLQQTASVGGPFSLIDGDGRRVTDPAFAP